MADTVNYMIAGYGIAFFILGVFVVSLWWRFYNLAQDEAAIEKIERETTIPEPKTVPQPAH